ncbi:MAG TPA: SRPBCC family protein [Allosphingosinicella sp.]|nr:SRPBCC family protein [Allosphingosinicella sp.]
MTGRKVTHSSFVIEHLYDAAPARVWKAWSTLEAKSLWFGGGEGNWTQLERAFDFRVGGREKAVGRWNSGTVSAFDALYWDIIPEERIVYTYEMHIDDSKISVSLATVELRPEGEGTRLKVSESGAFLDGYEDAGSREHGTRWLLDKLGESLKEEVNG